MGMGSAARKAKQIKCIIKPNAMVSTWHLILRGNSEKWYKKPTSELSHPSETKLGY